MKIFLLILLLYSTKIYANCINVNGEIYCNQNSPSPSIQYAPQQQYSPSIPYYPPPVYQPPQVIITPQVTPGNPNFQKYEYDTGKVFKRKEN